MPKDIIFDNEPKNSKVEIEREESRRELLKNHLEWDLDLDNFRILNPHETIEKGDEFWNPHHGWIGARALNFEAGDSMLYRRQLKKN